LREDDSSTLSPGTWVAQLRQLQSGVTQLITTIVNAQNNPDPRLELLAQTVAGRFSLAMQQALFGTDRTGETGSLELFAELGVEGAAIDRLATALGDSEPAISTLRTMNADRSRTVRTGEDELGGLEAYAEYDTLTSTLQDGIEQQLATSADAARTRALVNGGVTLAALVAAILLALLISRTLLDPIRRVREGTLNVAHEQLPEAVARIRAGADPGRIVPIDVTTEEEVGQMARAVDDMHRQAVHLATGEARLRAQVSEMFVTLSRRSTSLINQQLGLIEALEKDEEDPQRLESLFRLDHLAARMRRTADSLLILADAPTRVGITDELTVADCMQAATAGVQDYQRVRIGTASVLRIREEAAADVVHLLTELVDNALSYSPPTSMVSLTSTEIPGALVIEIEDAGLGIPEKTLVDINDSLRSGAEVTADTARQMGLFVVSRLAQKHGIGASLRRNLHNGTTARVVLPGSVFIAAAAPEALPPVAEPAKTPVTTKPDGATGPEPIDLDARINAAIGLQRRQPKAFVQEPVVEEPVAVETAVAEPVLVEPLVAKPVAAESTAPAREQAPRVVPTVTAPAGAVRQPALAAPLAATHAKSEEDTPIFKALRSAWLTADGDQMPWRSTEIEEGWDRADKVVAPPSELPVNAAGLPVRRPGTRLVPGGVSKPATATVRDPEAVRARLAAHAAGVSRGRATAANNPINPPSEAGQA
jgi:signal transduction histidine kinase